MNEIMNTSMLNLFTNPSTDEFTNTLKIENETLLEKNKKLYRKVKNQKRLILRLKNIINKNKHYDSNFETVDASKQSHSQSTDELERIEWEDVTEEIKSLYSE